MPWPTTTPERSASTRSRRRQLTRTALHEIGHRLEVCDALVRNAVELAQLYEDDRARRVLLGLVDKYLAALR